MILTDSMCVQCSTEVAGHSGKCNSCLRIEIEQKLEITLQLNLEGVKCHYFYPKSLLKEIHDYIIRDIDDLIAFLEQSFWTPAALMSARILETGVRNHIKGYLHERPPNEFWKCVDYLKNMGYVGWFVEELDELRKFRNTVVHGKRRYSPKDTIKTCKRVLTFVCWLYNMK